MRLWSIHPKYLDSKGLVALWREGLLAKRVLEGKTKGYRHHPQLERFRREKEPLKAINSYLQFVSLEAKRRGYCFDCKKLHKKSAKFRTKVWTTRGQLEYELSHLKKKLGNRNPSWLKGVEALKRIEPHPMIRIRKGAVEEWETGYSRD